ncbi:hypothetical protein [Jeotgalicoccus meleagridis]|nr:hypothetical protein [Jeotgalicoccus meleagridis]
MISNEENYSSKFFNRKVSHIDLKNYKSSSEEFYNLTFYKLLKSVFDNTKTHIDEIENINTVHINKATIMKGNSTHILHKNSFSELHDLGITSPPYFNAREYSQWPNLILYLFDMLFNAEAIYKSLKYKGIYAYNIGDIVDRDNIYINSQMSIRRQMLGFYSMMIFEIVGFQIIGNDI